jgi:hypothetical protein
MTLLQRTKGLRFGQAPRFPRCSTTSALTRAFEIWLKKLAWPTPLSFFRNPILDFGERFVCSLVYSFEDYLRRNTGGRGTDNGREAWILRVIPLRSKHTKKMRRWPSTLFCRLCGWRDSAQSEFFLLNPPIQPTGP